ncbi:MAG: hypothetical protein M3155_06495, partial [Actinomycetota bacterium]|nr:hypothetical protein [Actinomycetota bacterium]
MGKRSRRRTPGEAASEAPEASEAPDAPEQTAPSAPAADAAPRTDPTGRAAWILLETYRWVVQRGEAPGPEVWDDLAEFPDSREVEELFGSWEQLWEAAGLYDAPYFKALDEADAEHEDLASRRDAT